MRFLTLLVVTLILAFAAPANPAVQSHHDREASRAFADREADWRNGPIVYQVIVDRFAPSETLDAKAELYAAPRRLREWDEEPRRGTYLEEVEVWSHEIDFWGGDLDSLRAHLDWVEELGVDVLYLNPIHKAFTNHKYDAQDYFEISPEYGTREDLRELARDVNARGMRLMLDGVFNHMGRTSPYFQQALADPRSEYRDWFYIDEKYALGYRAWVNVNNLPELNLESPVVRGRLWNDSTSVVRSALADGVSGWRLDVAFDIGPAHLRDLRSAAQREKSDALIIGEVWNYPSEWMPDLDGIMNMTLREMILQLVYGNISGERFGRMMENMVDDTGIEPLLKCWVVLDNHDTPRLNHSLREQWQQRLAQVLQFTLPGAPNLYYGVELGMTGGDDPEQRGPMRWDLATDDNETLTWTRELIGLRRDNRALRIGDYIRLETDHLLAFLRRTDRAAESVLVVVNPTDETRAEHLLVRDPKMMSFTRYRDALSDAEATLVAGVLWAEVPAHTARVFLPVIEDTHEYTPYKRVW